MNGIESRSQVRMRSSVAFLVLLACLILAWQHCCGDVPVSQTFDVRRVTLGVEGIADPALTWPKVWDE